MKFFYLLLSFVFSIVSCGNPAIIRYLSPVKTVEKDLNPANRKYLVYENSGVKIYLQHGSTREIQEFALLGNTDNMEFRIPALTYIKFIIENNSNNDFKINLFNIKLKNSSEKVYRLINRNDFSTKFTSVAYSNFRYNKIFSFYTIAFQGVKPKKENYYEKIDPETEITLKPEYTGIQLLPFELISERYLDYILQMPINVEKTLEIPLKYIIYRKDYKQ